MFDLFNRISSAPSAIWTSKSTTSARSSTANWESVRSHFNDLQEGMISRKRAESNRINDMLRGELIEIYKPTTKQIDNR
jgi:hypothetical protein